MAVGGGGGREIRSCRHPGAGVAHGRDDPGACIDSEQRGDGMGTVASGAPSSPARPVGRPVGANSVIHRWLGILPGRRTGKTPQDVVLRLSAPVTDPAPHPHRPAEGWAVDAHRVPRLPIVQTEPAEKAHSPSDTPFRLPTRCTPLGGGCRDPPQPLATIGRRHLPLVADGPWSEFSSASGAAPFACPDRMLVGAPGGPGPRAPRQGIRSPEALRPGAAQSSAM